MKHVGLLRGINVGGKNIMPMKDLAQIFEKAGCREVRTYIQSGNVVFVASAALMKKLASVVSSEIVKKFGFQVPVVLRSHEQLAAVIRDNPFLPEEPDTKLLYVAFLSGTPESEAVKKLDPDRSPPDRFAVIGREVHMHLLNGAAKTKLTNAWMDSKLSTISTARNWATVLKLHELTGDSDR